MEDGESECVLVEPEEGDSVRLPGGKPMCPMLLAEDKPEPDAMGSVEEREAEGRGEYGFGLSFPVGPLPSRGRFAGGRLSAARRLLFSSSSSATRSSKACREWDQYAETARGTRGGRTSR